MHQPYYLRMIYEGNSYYKTSYIKYISEYNIPPSNSSCTCFCWSHKKKKYKKANPIGNCCIIQGLVTRSIDNSPVASAIVSAIRKFDSKVFTGITNKNGQYSIRVPKGYEYSIESFYSCEDCCEPAPCGDHLS